MTEKYDSIITMASKICKGSSETEDVAHYVITEFMHHERAEELVIAKQAMQFMSGMMWRSFNSSTSAYHTLYREKGRVHSITRESDIDGEYLEYNQNQDEVIGAIQGILEDMMADKSDLWYRATLFQMYIDEPNYSELSRRTDIPRTSISQGVEEAKKYIRKQLQERGIEYDI